LKAVALFEFKQNQFQIIVKLMTLYFASCKLTHLCCTWLPYSHRFLCCLSVPYVDSVTVAYLVVEFLAFRLQCSLMITRVVGLDDFTSASYECEVWSEQSWAN